MGAQTGSDLAREAARRGFRALVTRPPVEAASLAAALARRGVEAIVEPLLDIRYRDGPLPELAGVQAILCTSANGVRALARLGGERGIRLFAVGEATAARARAEGFASVESAAGDVADLARLVGARLSPADGRLLHVAGRAAAGDLAGDLRARGFTVERVVLYEAAPAAALSAATVEAIAAGRVDVALFFSPRTAAVFVRLAAAAGLVEAARRTVAISISAAADRALAPLPFRARLIAERPDEAALLAALDRMRSERHCA